MNDFYRNTQPACEKKKLAGRAERHYEEKEHRYHGLYT